MSIQQTIDQEIKSAMIAKDQARLEALRMLKSAVKYAAIEKPGSPQTDADILQVIQKQIKQRRESVAQFSQNGRADLASKEEAEIKVLEAFLPKQMSDDELSGIVDETIRAIGASGKKDFGRAMKACAEALAGRADNKRISDLLGKRLS